MKQLEELRPSSCPSALLNGLNALATQQTGSSREEEEVAVLAWWFRRSTRTKALTNQTHGLPAQLPFEGVRKRLQVVKCVFPCSSERTPVTSHSMLVNSCPPTTPPRTS